MAAKKRGRCRRVLGRAVSERYWIAAAILALVGFAPAERASAFCEVSPSSCSVPHM
jgi:hypothetical protein